MMFCKSKSIDDNQCLLKSMEELESQKIGINSAFETLKASLEELNQKVPGAKDFDLKFLKNLLSNRVMNSLIKLQERLETGNKDSSRVISNSTNLVNDIKDFCTQFSDRDLNARELRNILNNPHFEAVMEAHDVVATKSYDEPELDETESFEMEDFAQETSAYRKVGIRKKGHEPLGMTVQTKGDNIVISRILRGGLIDLQGLLHVGDIILEVNGNEVSTPQELIENLRKSKDSVWFKIVPSFQEQVNTAPCYMRALYSYDPSEDSLLPCKELGLGFNQGDVLEIVNQEDPNWWQARRTDIEDAPTGLIPSQELEEKRKAFVRPEFDYATKTSICGTRVTKKKKKEMYQIQANNHFDKAELMLYEEVCRIPPFERKTLVLVGAQGVGRRTFKSRLINYDPERFAAAIPHTSRPIKENEQDGKVYHFVKREIMEADINNQKYLEWGEYDGYLYGTKLDSVRSIIRSGKMVVLDCNPQCLKILKSPEFMPFVVFIAAPPIDQLRYMNEWGRSHGLTGRSMTLDRALGRQSRRARTLQSLASFYEDEDLQATIEESALLHRTYEKYFDVILVNNNFEKTFEDLKEALNALSIERQWVPINWIFSD